MKDIIARGIENSISYRDYKIQHNLRIQRELNRKNQDISMLEYLKLNKTRMKRLDSRFELKSFDRKTIKKVTNRYTWLVIAEPWCGDAAQVLPIINKMTSNCSQVDFKIALRDQNPKLMDMFLTRGKKSIPKLIALNNDLEVLFTWGPRPKEAQKIVENEVRIHRKMTREGQIELQKWYNENGGVEIEKEILALIERTLQKI